jgi:hypothetical protein
MVRPKFATMPDSWEFACQWLGCASMTIRMCPITPRAEERRNGCNGLLRSLNVVDVNAAATTNVVGYKGHATSPCLKPLVSRFALLRCVC